MNQRIKDLLESEDKELVELGLSMLTGSDVETYMYICQLVNRRFVVYPTESGYKVADRSFPGTVGRALFVKDPTKMLKLVAKI